MIRGYNPFELGGRGPVSIQDDVGRFGDLVFLMVRHDLEAETRCAPGHGREFDKVGDEAPAATTAG